MTKAQGTRKEALESGAQREVSEMARQAGLPLRVFITARVWNDWIVPDEKSKAVGQDERTRLSHVFDKLRYAIRVQRNTSRSNDTLHFDVSLTKEGESEKVLLMSKLAVTDLDDPGPCITIMMPDE